MSTHPAGTRHADLAPAHQAATAPPAPGHLHPLVWPASAKRDEVGALVLGGTPIAALTSEYATPLLVLDEEEFRSRAREYATAFGAAFPSADVFYAGKAFLCRALAGWVNEEHLGLDVCTAGELAVALAAGFPPERLTFHGNNKSVAELREALTVGVGRIVIDSFIELERLHALARELHVRPRVLVRVTVGVEAHTHEYIATAHEDQKFGLSLASGAAAEAVRQILAADLLELLGLHSHIGSQIFDTSGFEVSAHRLVVLAAEIRDEHGVELRELDLGGGLGVAYTPADDPAEVKEIATLLREIVERECSAAQLSMPHITVEPGRALVGPAGVTLYEVGTVKHVPLSGGTERVYISVDGGMSDNIRTALYDADFTCVLANRVGAEGQILARVVGKHCEAGDVVVKEAWLPEDVRPGDLLAVAATGAYCRSMASTYNHVPRPAVVAVRDGDSRVLLRRETLDDLLALDVG
jgi:diaminopimelate decarboxylase